MMQGRNRYRFIPYLRDRIAFIIAFLSFGIIMTLMMIVMRTALDAIILLDATMIMLLIASLACDFVRRKGFWRNVEDVSGSIDKVEHFGDLMDDPSFLEGEIAKDSLDELSKCAEAEICELRQNHRSYSEYIEQWVHDIKTPIATSKLILNQEHGAEADALRQEVERIEGLVEQALFAARTESLANDYIISSIRLLDVVSDACKGNMQLLTAKNVRLNMNIDTDIHVLADKTWIEFILSQLIVNSAKYDSTEISFSSTDVIEGGSNGETILELKDDGCGIPAEDVPRVFDRGFTGSVGRSHGSATGMGLYLAARMCAKMGLGISVASEEGVGTKVRIRFPHDDQRRLFIRNLT